MATRRPSVQEAPNPLERTSTGLVYPLFFLMSVLDVGLWFATGYAEAQGALGLALAGLFGTLAYAVVRGKYGNAWVRSFLVSRGYVLRNGS